MSKPKRGKFFTSILIGGALGSLAALLFGGKKKKDPNLDANGKPKGFFSRLFKR